MLNDLSFFRLYLAFTVVFFHVGILTNLKQFSWMLFLFDANFAVKSFFVLSGYLIFKSFSSSYSVIDFFKKRLNRIFPAYFFAILFGLIIVLLTGNLWIFNLNDISFLKYLIANIFLLNFIQPTFDNVFQTNPVQTINGSLWTIKIEFFFYLLTPLLIYLYQKINKYLWVATFSIVSYVWTIYFLEFSSSSQAKQFSYQIPGQLIYFVLGGFFSFNKFSKKGFILIPILYFINDYFPYSFLFVATYPFFITFITIFIITLDFNIVSIKRDISYGVYLYHFPLIQLFVYYGLFEVNSYLYLLVMMIILTFLSIFSNLFIEKIKFFN